MRYTDFELYATEPRAVKAEGKKRLTFSLLIPRVFNNPRPCELDIRTLDDLKDKASSADADWNDARTLGEALSRVLLPPDVWNVLESRIAQATAEKEGIRVRLTLSGSELNKWPWEFILFNRAGGENKVSDFLALMPNLSIVRHNATALPAWRVEAKAPVKVVVAIASPSGWPKLKITDERLVVEKALEDNPQLTVACVDHARRSQLPDKLNPAHIFHFAGHGKFEEVQSATPGANEGKASIVLEDEYGDEDPLDAELLAVQLRDAGVRVAVLGACQTAQRDDVGAWSSMSEALLKAELGAVVGMQFPVDDKSALLFAEHFYASLAAGLSIDEAVAAGRVAVAVSDDPRGWATPVLYLRSPDGVIFSELASDQRLETARIKAYQRIDTLRGKAINADIGHVATGAAVEATSIIGEVKEGATAINVKADTVGGSVDSRQEIKEVKGETIGVSIKNLG
jgi:CHAT domain